MPPSTRSETRTPLVSVVLAVHNGAATVGAAVDSIFRQSVRSLELIVVDDGSTDDSRAVVESRSDSRLRIVALERRGGLARALNVGVAEARATIVARLDADDIALPERLERQLTRMSRSPTVSVLGSAAHELRADSSVGRVLAPLCSPAGARWTAMFGSPFLHPTAVFDRRRFHDLGLVYDEGLRESEDYDLWARALTHVEGGNLVEPLVLYRVHPGQASQARRGLQEQIQRRVSLRTMRAWLPDLAVGDEEWDSIRVVGAGGRLSAGGAGEPLEGLLDLAADFLRRNRLAGEEEVRWATARAVIRNLPRVASNRERAALLRRVLRLDPRAVVDAPAAAVQRIRGRASRRRAQEWLRALA